MKKLLLASVGVLALGATAASAADLICRPPPPAPEIAPPYDWTGFYIGINGGGGFGRSDLRNVFGATGVDVSGGLVGGTLGDNYQSGPWVFGIEGDGDWGSIKGSTSSGICAGTSREVRNDWLTTLRGRVGYSFGRFMPYVTGGAAFGDIKQPVRPPTRPAGRSAAA